MKKQANQPGPVEVAFGSEIGRKFKTNLGKEKKPESLGANVRALRGAFRSISKRPGFSPGAGKTTSRHVLGRFLPD